MKGTDEGSHIEQSGGWGARKLARIDEVQGEIARVGQLEDISALLNAIPERDWNRKVDRIEVGQAVVRRLEELGTHEAWEALLGLRRNEDMFVRSEVVDAIGRSKDERADPYLADALDDDEKVVRLQAIGWIGERRDALATPKLLEMLEATHGVEQLSVAQALAKIGDPEVEPALRQARRNEWRPWIRFAIPRKVSDGHS